MEISKAAVGVLAGLCLAVGAGGAYILSGGDDAPSAAFETGGVSPDPAAAAVEQSEATVSDAEPVAEAEAAQAQPDRVPAAAAERLRPTSRPEPRTAPPGARTPSRPAAPAESTPAPLPREEPRFAIPPALEPARPLEPEAVRAPEPPVPQFEDLIVSADSVIGLQVETSLTSERARVEDEVTARVTRDVRVGDRVAIPSGARVLGEVTMVERGGRLKDRARLGIRFTSIVLADGTRVPIETETIYREGDAPGGESAAKIGGGAIAGAIIGGIFGGGKGAILGGTAGAGAGSAAVLAGGRNPATLPAGTPVTVRIEKPATVTVEK
jgi:hypothetical protein